MSFRYLSLIPVLAFALASTPARADDQEEDESSDHARVSALAGELFVKGPFDEEEQSVTLNYILREGDELRTGPDTFAEIELPRSTFVRFSAQTAARIQTIEGQVEIDLIRGSSYLSQGADAPDAAIAAELGAVGSFSRTVVRFETETGPNGFAIARVAEGSAEASCEGKFTTLAVRDVLTCDKNGGRRGKWSVDSGDAFDRWNQEREKKVRTYQAPPAQVAGNYQGMQDLDGQGEWVVVEQRYYWRPHVEISWRPYNDGYWAWCDWLGGWTWISHSPWGHVTHHYGRWLYVGRHGWVWSPAPRFGPAWVVWASFDGYLGWAPCDFWGRPVVVVSTHTYYDHYAWSFSRPHYFVRGGGNYRRIHREPRDRPFFTMGPDEIRNVRGRAVKDPRVLRPETTLVRQRTEVAARVKNVNRIRGKQERVRQFPTRSELPRIVEDDSRRKVQVHEAARVRAPIALPRREIARRDDGDGIPVRTRPESRVIQRDPDVEDSNDRVIDRGDRVLGGIERNGDTVRRTPTREIDGNDQRSPVREIDDGDRPSPVREIDDNDRRSPVREIDDDRPRYQPPRKDDAPAQWRPQDQPQPAQKPTVQQPRYQPPQRSEQPRATTTPPTRRELPRSQSSASQSRPQYQPQPQARPQPQVQPKPQAQSKPQAKPTYSPPPKQAPVKSTAPAQGKNNHKSK